MDESSRNRRTYDSPTRREQAAQTRDRIVSAGVELVRAYQTWDWRELTFRAVATRAGVGERTVYRHFPTERALHDAVMRRLEDEADIAYEDVDLANLTAVTGRFFTALQGFTVGQSVQLTPDPTFIGADERRRRAVLRAVSSGAPELSEDRRRAVAGLLDVLWNVPSYERLVGAWQLSSEDASGALTWLIAKVIAAAEGGEAPPTPT